MKAPAYEVILTELERAIKGLYRDGIELSLHNYCSLNSKIYILCLLLGKIDFLKDEVVEIEVKLKEFEDLEPVGRFSVGLLRGLRKKFRTTREGLKN